MALIAINLAVFVWQLGFSSDDYSSPELRQLGVAESDQNVIEYGAIPYRVLHPGNDCAVGGISSESRRVRAEVVCEGSEEYDEAETRPGGAPFVPLDEAPWWATVLTSMFMHGGILHLAGNMLFLWVFGNNIEDSMGRPRFVLFYLLAGAVAVYAQSLLDPSATVPTIGASGAVSGVLGAYILLHPRARVLTFVIIIFFFTFIEIPALVMLGIWFVLQALPAFGEFAATDVGEGEGGIAYLAHIGGFVFGLATIKLFANRHRRGLSGVAAP